VFLLDLAILAVALARGPQRVFLGWGVVGLRAPGDVGGGHHQLSCSGRHSRMCGTWCRVLFLFRSHFRRAAYRVAEAMTAVRRADQPRCSRDPHGPPVVRLLAVP